MKINSTARGITSSLAAIIVVLVLIVGLLFGIVVSPVILRNQETSISTTVVTSTTTQIVPITSIMTSLETVPTTATSVSTYTSYVISASPSNTTTLSSQSGLVYTKFSTSQGTFEAELFQSLMPKTVDNFVTLANSGFYNDLVWHRIVPGFVIQTGDPTTRNASGSPCSWGTGGSNSTIPFEYAPSLPNDVGYIGMASTAAGAPGTSQFYINLANNTSLNGNYAVFGMVISGMNVVDAIAGLPTTSCPSGGTPPANPSEALLISVTIQNSP